MTIGFWIILFSFLLYGILHSWLASIKFKTQIRLIFGQSTDRWFRFVYNLIAVVTLLPILVLPVVFIDKELYRIPYPWILATIGIQILAGIGLFIGLVQTGVRSFLGIRQVFISAQDSPSIFVTDGLYRWVRHPLYTAGLLIIWLFPVMTCNLLALNIGITIYIVTGAKLEERKLEREFGEAYEEYKKETPMLIPFVRRH